MIGAWGEVGANLGGEASSGRIMIGRRRSAGDGLLTDDSDLLMEKIMIMMIMNEMKIVRL